MPQSCIPDPALRLLLHFSGEHWLDVVFVHSGVAGLRQYRMASLQVELVMLFIEVANAAVIVPFDPFEVGLLVHTPPHTSRNRLPESTEDIVGCLSLGWRGVG